jgi:hypothetical protein
MRFAPHSSPLPEGERELVLRLDVPSCIGK